MYFIHCQKTYEMLPSLNMNNFALGLGYSPLRFHRIQVNLDITDSMGPGKSVRHMQNPSYTYDEYLIFIGLGPSISSVICKKSAEQWSVISKFTCIEKK